MSEAKLNWSTAKVKNSKLTVDLDGELPSGWKDSFDTVARLLAGPGDWGEVSLKKKGTVCVTDVSEGSEERLRHFLESVVEQANADHRPDNSSRDESDQGDDENEDASQDREESGPDGEMSERFRSFAN
jgi:hypothetical protein